MNFRRSTSILNSAGQSRPKVNSLRPMLATSELRITSVQRSTYSCDKTWIRDTLILPRDMMTDSLPTPPPLADIANTHGQKRAHVAGGQPRDCPSLRACLEYQFFRTATPPGAAVIATVARRQWAGQGREPHCEEAKRTLSRREQRCTP